MVWLLLAFQLSTTNCINNGAGGSYCTTTQPEPDRPVPNATTSSNGDVLALINLRHRKAIGKMLAVGDCAGAEKYALEKGEIELAKQVRDYCASERK